MLETTGDSGAAPVTGPRPNWLALVEWAALATASVLWLVLAVRLAAVETISSRAGWVAMGVALGYLASDFFSGIVHWFCDTFFEEDTPLVGRMLIEPFREHHRDPLAMTHHGLAEIAGPEVERDGRDPARDFSGRNRGGARRELRRPADLYDAT